MAGEHGDQQRPALAAPRPQCAPSSSARAVALHNWSDLNAVRGQGLRVSQCLVKIGRLDEEEPAELLGGLSKRSVGDEHVPRSAPAPHRPGAHPGTSASCQSIGAPVRPSLTDNWRWPRPSRDYAGGVPQLRLALAQVDATVGDLAGNADRVVEWTHRAAQAGAHVVAFPEMFVTGYPIEDLALRASFVDASRRAATELADRLKAEQLGDLVVVTGFLDRAESASDRLGVPKGSPLNAAAVITAGEVVATYAKHHLPNYGVFDEYRYFVPGDTAQVIQVHGIDIAIAICEDLWQDGPSQAAYNAEAGLLLVINGSPYERCKDDARLELCARRAREGACALAYVNMVGGQDELVFDGDSLVVDASGGLVSRAAQFEEELLVVDLDLRAATPAMPDTERVFGGLHVRRTVVSAQPLPPYRSSLSMLAPRLDDLGEVYRAITLGLRDYVRKNGFRSVLLGLSGGIDSTVVGVLACDAIGPENVYGVSNPSAWSSEHSRTDVAELARRTRLHLQTIPIGPLVSAFLATVPVDGIAEENVQARIRAVLWMALSNQHGHLVLACGNKSELATGYSTIYGDAVGGFAPLKDVPKTLVYELVRHRNARSGEPLVPPAVIERPPSAELRPDQRDDDSLPPYEALDRILDAYVVDDRSRDEIVAAGDDAQIVDDVVRMVDLSEYKRRQAPPGIRITAKAFGRDRRLPITNRFGG